MTPKNPEGKSRERPGTREVFELTAIRVTGTPVDGAPVESDPLGLFSCRQTAIRWLRRKLADPQSMVGGWKHDESVFFLYFELISQFLDRPDRACKSFVYNREGRYIGSVHGYEEKAWKGRPAETCKYKERDVVAWVMNDKYRIGVVIYRPR